MNICIIAGARPNFIKIAPIVRAVDAYGGNDKSGISCTVVYAGAEDDPTLEPSLFSDLQMRRPDVYLGVTSADVHIITAEVTERLAAWIGRHRPDAVIVVDDLASTMAAAIVAKKQDILLAHLVAGTRSFDIHVPKEINRLVIDGLSDILFTAGVSSNSTATREGVGQERIYMVGNIIIDSLRFCKPREKKPLCLDDIAAGNERYLLFTINRKSLIANTEKLRGMIDAIIRNAGDCPIVAPLRPDAVAAVKKVLDDLNTTHYLYIVSPMAYTEFAYASSHAMGIITDSGNVAEEATFNGVPCATLNTYTEHEETVSVGTNRLVGDNVEKIGNAVADMVAHRWPHGAIPDRWDGRTADRILQTLISKIGTR